MNNHKIFTRSSICMSAALALLIFLIVSTAVPAAAVSEISAERCIQKQVVNPGGVFTVNIIFTSNQDGLMAPCLNEDLPDGWTIISQDSSAPLFKPDTNEWVWMSYFNSGTTFSVTYEVFVPENASYGDYSLNGSVSAVLDANEVFCIVGGDLLVTVSPAPELSIIEPEPLFSSYVGYPETFVIVVDQPVNLTWKLDSNVVQNDFGVWNASCTLAPEELGIHDLSVFAENINGNDIESWNWTVIEPPMVAERIFSSTDVVPGDNFTVTVNILAREQIFAPALNEDLPESWMVAPVTEGNDLLFKNSTNEWVWIGSMVPNESRNVVYEVHVPLGTEYGPYSLEGVISGYQISPIFVEGDKIIRVVELSILSFAPENEIVSFDEGILQTFSLTTNRLCNFTWEVDGVLMKTESGLNASSLTCDKDPGVYTVSAIAAYGTAEVKQNWNLTVVGDWNPWNDPESAGRSISTLELQQAIACWLSSTPAPNTGAEITTLRLQTLIASWLTG